LQARAVIRKLAQSIEYKVNNFFTNGVVTTSVVVRGIFLTGDDLFWVEQLTVCTGANFVGYGWFQVNEYASWNVLASASFREKGVESIVAATDGFVGWHLTVRLDSVFQAVKLPASITDLKTTLANVD